MTSTATVKPRPSKLNRFERVDLNDAKAMDSNLFRPMETSNEKHQIARKVQFDPRIVITEFDEELQREWFSEGELNSFKAETVYLAQQYMLEHPMMAEEFTRSEIDPITGKERKRALFSLPFLSTLPDDSLTTTGNTRVDRNKLARAEIRKILVADPNKMILQLFCKSLKQIFPHAEFAVAQSGEDALRLYESALGSKGTRGLNEGRGFDVVIVDEKLHRAVSMGNGIMSGQLKNVDGIHTRSVSTTALIPDKDGPGKPTSLSNLQSLSSPTKRGSGRRRGMTGSELLKRICRLEDERQGEGPDAPVLDSEAASLQTTIQRKPLLIGVSVDLVRDGKSLQDSGADMVWGKPPPKMNETLRNQMLSALITKRQQSGLCVRLPTGEQDT
jgi:CheY-like chemotaxis protein